MSKRSKFIVSATLIVLLLPIIIFFSIESYFPLAPYIDTRFSKDFDIDKFEKIEVGTSIDDVRLLIGEPIVHSIDLFAYPILQKKIENKLSRLVVPQVEIS